MFSRDVHRAEVTRRLEIASSQGRSLRFSQHIRAAWVRYAHEAQVCLMKTDGLAEDSTAALLLG